MRHGKSWVHLIVLVCLTGGCATSDAPRLMTKTLDSWGVAMHSSGVVESLSTVRGISHTAGVRWTSVALEQRAGTITQSCYNDGCWKVQSVPGTPGETCESEAWDMAIRTMLRTEAFLMGNRKPTPIDLTILLIPHADTYIGKFSDVKAKRAPLTLVFHQPHGTSCSTKPTSNGQRGIAKIVAMVAYESQHVNFALNRTVEGATSWNSSSLVKNEANSQCWKYAIRSILAWQAYDIEIPVFSAETE